MFFLGHAEAVLFIDDDEAQRFIFHVFGQQFVSADDNVDLTFG